MTEQAHKDECDINLILADYTRTGFIKHAKENKGVYDDVSAVDFQKAMETVANVKSLFEGLPAQVRKEFDGNPSYFLNYVQDPKNHDALVERGIIVGNDGIDINGAYVNVPTGKNTHGIVTADSGVEGSSVSEPSSSEPQTSDSASA
jgi:phage internal scaffolding protein